MPNRNSEVLADFVKYCEAHPDERFWQALRNWSNHSFVYVSNTPRYNIDMKREHEYLTDTFYSETKDV